MTRVNIGGLYEEFDTIEDVIRYLTFERDERYRVIADALVELLKKHDEDFECKLAEEHNKEIDDLQEEIAGLESKIRSAYDELERYNDELDYEDDDTVDIHDVKGFIQKVEVELL